MRTLSRFGRKPTTNQRTIHVKHFSGRYRVPHKFRKKTYSELLVKEFDEYTYIETPEAITVKLPDGRLVEAIIGARLDNHGRSNLRLIGKRVIDWIRKASARGVANASELKHFIKGTDAIYAEGWRERSEYPSFYFFENGFRSPGHEINLFVESAKDSI